MRDGVGGDSQVKRLRERPRIRAVRALQHATGVIAGGGWIAVVDVERLRGADPCAGECAGIKADGNTGARQGHVGDRIGNGIGATSSFGEHKARFELVGSRRCGVEAAGDNTDRE